MSFCLLSHFESMGEGLDFASKQLIKNTVVLKAKGGCDGFLSADGLSFKCVVVRDFDGFYHSAVAENSRHQKRICTAPVFSLDVIRFSANIEVRIVAFLHRFLVAKIDSGLNLLSTKNFLAIARSSRADRDRLSL